MEVLKPKFMVSENLNKLAQYLRFLGYDTTLYRAVSFHRIVNLCQKERRIYLTRSKKEAKSAHKFNRRLIKNIHVVEQLKEIIDLVGFHQNFIFTRCSRCNWLLGDIDKERIKELVPQHIYESHKQYKYCKKCGKIFWQGTHYEKLKRELENIINYLD